jgi:hypothetical protein
MLAGNAKAKTFDNSLAAKAVEYVCLGTSDGKVNSQSTEICLKHPLMRQNSPTTSARMDCGPKYRSHSAGEQPRCRLTTADTP